MHGTLRNVSESALRPAGLGRYHASPFAETSSRAGRGGDAEGRARDGEADTLSFLPLSGSLRAREFSVLFGVSRQAEEEASCLLPSSVLGFAKAATPLHCLDSVKGGTDLLNFCFYLHDALLFQVEKAESSSRLSLDIAVLPDDFRLRLGEVSSLLRFPEKAASKCLAPELLIPLLHVAPLTVFCASVVSRFSEEFAVAASKDGGRASLQRLWVSCFCVFFPSFDGSCRQA